MSESNGKQNPKGGRGRGVSNLVESRVRRLASALAGDSGSAKATLASLRNALYESPGKRPELWDITSVPEREGEFRGNDPTWEEVSVHLAMCLFARHQQSQASSMHQSGIGLGEAVKRVEIARNQTGLTGSDGKVKESGVRRRFNAAATSVSVQELTRHLAGLVSLMRQEHVGLDYRMLAEDLFQFQTPGGPDAVRLRWARQYARNIKESK